MPPLEWPVDPIPVNQQFAPRRNCQEAGALLNFAVWTAESVTYLPDVDCRDDLSTPTINGHAAHVVDVAHTRWAVGSCITTLDLCAAALGRALCA
jgi:hypothetical protein